jgi:hypothetical protein
MALILWDRFRGVRVAYRPEVFAMARISIQRKREDRSERVGRVSGVGRIHNRASLSTRREMEQSEARQLIRVIEE